MSEQNSDSKSGGQRGGGPQDGGPQGGQQSGGQQGEGNRAGWPSKTPGMPSGGGRDNNPSKD